MLCEFAAEGKHEILRWFCPGLELISQVSLWPPVDRSQRPTQSIRSAVTSWPVSKECVCVSVRIKGSTADSAAVQCHTGSPSGMFLSPGMGCGASLAEPPLPVPCQPALGTAHLRRTLGERQLPVNRFRLVVSFCLSVWHLAVVHDGFFVSLNAYLSNYSYGEPSAPADFAAHCAGAANDSIPLPPFGSTSHVCHSEEAQCGFRGRTSVSRFTLFTINPGALPSVFTVWCRKSSGRGNIKQSQQYNAEQTQLTQLGISSNKGQTHHLVAAGFFKLHSPVSDTPGVVLNFYSKMCLSGVS